MDYETKQILWKIVEVLDDHAQQIESTDTTYIGYGPWSYDPSYFFNKKIKELKELLR